MVNDVLLVSKLFQDAGVAGAGAPYTERHFTSECVGCGLDQSLADARVVPAEPVGLITAYRCTGCDSVLVETGEWGFRSGGDQAAYRLGDYAVYMTSGLRILPN